MKKIAYLLVAIGILCAAPAFAQGPFTDVPTDHWAYDAVNRLQQDGVIIGYPDGTFAGKRTITRYEFAVAIARVLDTVRPGATGITREELNSALSQYAKKSDIPAAANLANLATKADVDALRKLVDEFRDELAALGVDVDALKRDVAALDARVTALEAEVRRVKITGTATVAAIAEMHRTGNGATNNAVDLDNRTIPDTSNLANAIGVIKDFDLNIVGRVSDKTTANATINYGNYLHYLGAIDDYVDGVRPVSKNARVGQDPLSTITDDFFPYYLYIDAATGNGNLSVGRLPLQFTPYTLKKIDVDAYTSILKSDSGYYPVDGAKLAMNLFNVDWTLYAAKHDSNTYLVNGLTGQPSDNDINSLGRFHVLNGASVGGLGALIDQSAGVRANANLPWNAKLGATFYQAWSDTTTANTVPGGVGSYDQARVYGADLALPVSIFSVNGSWTRSDTRATRNSGAPMIDDDNVAWDGSLAASFGKLGFAAGYKDIGSNFAAAGFWDKIGRWTNPVNVKGPYASFTYPIFSKLNLTANGEWLTVKDTVADTTLASDDTVLKVEGGLAWGFSPANSLALGVQWVKFDQDAGGEDANEAYYNIGWAHKVNSDAALKVSYQFINYDGGAAGFAYGADTYRAGLGVVEFGVSF
ncbi:MAG: S-layer homology domain-containing protein [Armatimonadota bacterium]|nr:S-layer homology domain-containing protein [bacterium]